MTRKFDIDKRNLVKKLKELEQETLFKTEKKGNGIYYSVNKKHPLFQEYRKIVLKTYGIENQLREILQRITGIDEAYIIGSYVKDKMDVHSDIDVLVIGDVSIVELHKKISDLQKNISREINVINMDKKEMEKKKKEKDSFVKQVFRDKKIRII